MTDPFRAIIFDMDGVLVDTEIWWDEIRRDFARQRGRAWTTEDRAAVMGHNSPGWARVMHERLALDEPAEAIEREVVDAMVARFAETGAPLIPGAVDTVRRVGRDYRLGVASSAHMAVIEAALRTSGLRDAFATITSSDEVEHGKPSPDVYLLAARRLAVPPRDCLVVEDSLNGVLSARAAGMVVVLIPNAAVPPAAGASEAADIRLDRIEDLEPTAIRMATSARHGATGPR